MTPEQRQTICHSCPYRGKLANRLLPCTADPLHRDIQTISFAGDCPKDLFQVQSPSLSQAAFWRGQLTQAALSPPIYPGGQGDGIVMAGGGAYFDAAYVSIRVIRMLGCTLPIELWHLGPMEIVPWQRSALEPLNVITRDAYDFEPPRPTGGWQLKSFAVCNSEFERVLYLDADCYPVYDPTRWFNSFNVYPSVFWPDQPQYELSDEIFRTVGIDREDSRPFESGQFLVDRGKCWLSLCLAQWMNLNSTYYYKLWKGDKETFRMAWLWFKEQINMPEKSYTMQTPAAVGYDFDGQPAFIHRCCGKLSLSGKVFVTNASPSIRNDTLPHEAAVWEFLEELRKMRGAVISTVRRGCCQ